MGFHVRPAREEDAAAILQLWHGFTAHLSRFDERYRHKETADERWTDYFRNRLVGSKYGAVFVAEDEADGGLLGVVEARVMGSHPIFRLENHGYVHGHFVLPDHRGEGVGEALLDAAAAWFAEPPRGVDFYRIDVLEGDDETARFYADAGLRPVEHVYEKRLEPADADPESA